MHVKMKSNWKGLTKLICMNCSRFAGRDKCVVTRARGNTLYRYYMR